MRDCEIPAVQCGPIADLVEELLADAAPLGCERRAQPRLTFFGPVKLIRLEDGERREISCFSRDISTGGIGLLHNAELELGPTVVRIPRRHGGTIDLPCEILWSRQCGEGWYVAGGPFVSNASAG